jgi:hypothetical protein
MVFGFSCCILLALLAGLFGGLAGKEQHWGVMAAGICAFVVLFAIGGWLLSKVNKMDASSFRKP